MKPLNLYKYITILLAILFSIFTISCSSTPTTATVSETKISETTQAPTTTVAETTTTIEATTTTEEIINAPEIEGLTFNQETKSYFNESGAEVGIYVEEAVKINGEMKDAVGLAPDEINKILEENRQEGIFKCPWSFDFKEIKEKREEIEIVELVYNPSYQQKIAEENWGIYLPSTIAIKFSEPINFYAPFEANDKAPKNVAEIFPDKKGDPDFFSTQGSRCLTLVTAFGYQASGAEGQAYGSFHFSFLDWQPAVALGEAYELGKDGLAQDIMSEVKIGDLLGKILPKTTDFNFLDFTNNPEYYENPNQFQGNLTVYDFQDDFQKPTSSLDKMLKYTNKAGQEIPVCVWPGENTAYD